MADLIIKDDPSRCMKCGFCMSTCPVYNIDQIEGHVARGRNILVQLAKGAPMYLADSFQEALYFCLLCGKCEAVCPAGLSSTAITLKASSDLIDKKGLTWFKRLIYRGLVKNRHLIARLVGLAALIPGFSVKKGALIRHFPDFISALFKGISIPRFSIPFLSRRIAERTSAAENVPVRGKIAVFSGCLFEFFFADMGKEMISSLAKAGYEVFCPPGQTCCGLPVYAAGDFDTAKSMAKSNIELLSQFDHIITGCASCGSTLKGYKNWFEGDAEVASRECSTEE